MAVSQNYTQSKMWRKKKKQNYIFVPQCILATCKGWKQKTPSHKDPYSKECKIVEVFMVQIGLGNIEFALKGLR